MLNIFSARAEDKARQRAEPDSRARSRRAPAAGTGGSTGMPLFLKSSVDTAMHNSPPLSGPGSRAEPLVHGRRSVQSVASMGTDAFYRSPVNRENPVIVWTDGARLFFAPSEAQVVAGRAAAAPEVSFSPLAGYVAEEIHWDRVQGLTTGGGALVVIARKSGDPDLEVAVTNTLEQKSTFNALGATSGAVAQVTRQGAEFMRVDESTVPLELSEAAAPGPIHGESFVDGFFRYRAPGGDHDLYVAQGSNPVAHLVQRTTGDITRTFAAGTIATVVAEPGGLVHLELTETARRGGVTRSTVTVDLRSSPPGVSRASGHVSAESGYDDAKARLEALNIAVHENGLRMRVVEMETIEQALALGGNRGLTALIEFRTMIGSAMSDPILEVTKSIGSEGGYGMADPSAGTPTLDIYEPFEDSPKARTATVRHEMTHVIMGAIDAVSRSRLTARERADLEGALRFEAARAQQKARAGLLRSSEYGAGDVRPTAGTRAMWRSAVESDVEIASIWVELLRRYSFIPDPEGTGEVRGVSVADESRYAGSSERTGHPADGVGEFVASFVTCATLFAGGFVADVLAA